MRRHFVAAAIALAQVLIARQGQGGTTVDFAFQDDRLLLPRQSKGARAFVPTRARPGESLPVVVLLHGTNEQGTVHKWLGGKNDLRTAYESWVNDGDLEPAILAAPSQTRAAWLGPALWREFSLHPFLSELQAALKTEAQLDLSRVIVVGHSGAGCNPKGGLLWLAGSSATPRPFALVAIDTCLDGDIARTLSLALPETSVGFWYQTLFWHRDFFHFRKAIANTSSTRLAVEEVSTTDLDAHTTIVPRALHSALQWLIPGDGTVCSTDEAVAQKSPPY